MKAVLQNFKNGKMAVEEVPAPQLKPNGVLVRTEHSLVSAGTEKSVIELAKMNPLAKARARPDLVKKVMEKAGQEGLIGTAKIVSNLVSAPLPLGYSSAGVVIEVGSSVSDISVGQRVACGGIGFANHAEVVYVPRNLIAPIPDSVSSESACFATVGAIAMQGFRQADLSLGETVVVLGMGLVGQLVTQIAKAAGCLVLSADLDESKLKLAKECTEVITTTVAPDEAEKAILNLTDGAGADAVIIAAATKSNAPIQLAPQLVRDRGKVVVLGDVGLDVPRRKFFEKEIDIKQSRSYGPGRYDNAYEEQGHDYPIGYVRWTENRNMDSFLKLLGDGSVSVEQLITHRYSIDQAPEAYDLLLKNNNLLVVGVVLNYPQRGEKDSNPLEVGARQKNRTPSEKPLVRLAIIGAGQFAQGILLPAFARSKRVEFSAIVTDSGLTALNVAKKYNAQRCFSDPLDAINDANVDAVVIATRHNTHAHLVIESLLANKHCFVEKPLALNSDELKRVIATYQNCDRILMTGFNRRFSKYARRLKNEIAGNACVMNYVVNAGKLPRQAWQQDNDTGGGRIVGEICHFIDVMQYVTGALPLSIQAIGARNQARASDPDNLSILVEFQNNTVGSILYTSDGNPRVSKEKFEIFSNGSVYVVDNWRSLVWFKGSRKKIIRSWFKSEKGFDEEIKMFTESIKTGAEPIPFSEQIAATSCTFAIQRAVRTGERVTLV